MSLAEVVQKIRRAGSTRVAQRRNAVDPEPGREAGYTYRQVVEDIRWSYQGDVGIH